MSAAAGWAAIPLPHAGAAARGEEGHGPGRLVAAFLAATAALPCRAAGELAGVRPETIRKWRRRLPRWLKASTRRRIAAHLDGGAPAPAAPEELGFRRAFRRALHEQRDDWL